MQEINTAAAQETTIDRQALFAVCFPVNLALSPPSSVPAARATLKQKDSPPYASYFPPRPRPPLYMDGVLVSPIGADERSWLRWASLHGMEDTFSIHSTHGRRTIETIRAVRPDLDVATELRRMEDFDAEDTNGTLFYLGVRELLAMLLPNHRSIVTSASERILRHRLELFGITLPRHFVTAESVTRGKPDPEPYSLGASQLGLGSSDCLVLEDAPSGIRPCRGFLTSAAGTARGRLDHRIASRPHACNQPGGQHPLSLFTAALTALTAPECLRAEWQPIAPRSRPHSDGSYRLS